MKKFIPAILVLVSLIGSFFIGRMSVNTPTGDVMTDISLDTITIRDTIKIDKPVPVNKYIVRNDTIILPTAQDSISNDSTKVVLPVVQNEYETPEYHAWVSGGYFASLDSLNIYPEKEYITKTVTNTVIKEKMKRWGIGIQAGYGFNGREFQPYIGVGVTCNLFGF